MVSINHYVHGQYDEERIFLREERIRMNDIQKRMTELIEPIDKQIYMCDDRRDLLMFNCAMLQRVREVFDMLIGVEGRKNMFKDLV